MLLLILVARPNSPSSFSACGEDHSCRNKPQRSVESDDCSCQNTAVSSLFHGNYTFLVRATQASRSLSKLSDFGDRINWTLFCTFPRNYGGLYRSCNQPDTLPIIRPVTRFSLVLHNVRWSRETGPSAVVIIPASLPTLPLHLPLPSPSVIEGARNGPLVHPSRPPLRAPPPRRFRLCNARVVDLRDQQDQKAEWAAPLCSVRRLDYVGIKYTSATEK
ncbi:hypothetical protein BC938DRAFT_471765 [Jimgerdemannia flammicorona]|uniref:Uncharacterized protein n=1 Tax=Jimgerdemannia flammicorona TaxID=994334 RepID=A0A433Q7H4_9FUNG|nr:hypothetical protein BC938DRAFT_471765 [Jimgerdemannia flammicorona]